MKHMPRAARKEPKTRMNLDIPAEVRSNLEDLRDLTHADSMSEVIRRALAVYDFLWHEKAKGASTFIRSRDGNERELVML
jgi:hypothetical protein